jgi:hypothetical protein
MMATYTTTYGRELEVDPISIILIQKLQTALQKDYEKRGISLEPPQYCTELPSGDRQCFNHDEETIKDDGTTDEERAEWKRYQENLSEFNNELGDRVLGAMVMDQPVDFEEGWEKRLEWLGVEIPEDELDRKMLYMTTRVLKTPEDIQGYMFRVMEISAGTAGEDAVEAARAMFRDKT